MNEITRPQIEPKAWGQILEALRTLGVAGIEDDLLSDGQNLDVARDDLVERLKKTGYIGGRLAMQPLFRPHDEVEYLLYDTGKFIDSLQAEQAWELDYRSKRQDCVNRRIEDWLQRLQDLRSQIATWIRERPEFSHLALIDLPPARLSEPLMRQFEVEPVDMPIFELRSGALRVMRFQPKGLWIIGANGRIDLITKSASAILVDRSEPLVPPSHWFLYSTRSKTPEPFDESSFSQLVRSGLE